MIRFRPAAVGAALLLLALGASAQPTPGSDGPRVSVSLEVRPLSAEAQRVLDAFELESRVMFRLMQEGFAVVAPFAGPDVFLEISSGPQALYLKASDVVGATDGGVPLGQATRAELQLEVAQKMVDLARARAAALAEAIRKARDAAARPEPPSNRVTDILDRERRRAITPVVPPPEPPPDVRVRPEVGLDALWRGSEVDPLVRAGVTLGTSRVAVTLIGGFSTSTAPGLRVDEWQIQLGPWVRLWKASRFSADVALLAGAVIHTWHFAEFNPDDPDGTHHDYLVTLPVQVGWQASDWLLIAVRFAPGVAGPALRRDHLYDFLRTEHGGGEVIWSREFARVEAGVSLAGTF